MPDRDNVTIVVTTPLSGN